MRLLKSFIRVMAIISLAAMAVTKELFVAISLLAFSSMSLGILIGERIDGGKKYEGKNK